MGKQQIILSHSGKQHSYHVAKALQELGYLKTFYTSSYISNTSLQQLIKKMDLSFLTRRFIDGVGGKQVSASWQYELKELIYRRVKGNTQAVKDMVFERDNRFDQDLSKKLSKLSFDTFWGFQGSSYRCLQKANELGRASVCEMTSAHVPYAKRMLKEEVALHPEWADSIEFASFPNWYEERLTQEPLVAKKVIAISSFLKQTLVQEGVAAEKITVIPLGFDANAINFREDHPSIDNRPLRLLYVGKITQQKGIRYLLEGMRSFNKKDVELHIIGNIFGSGDAFRSYKDVYSYSRGMSQQELFKAYQQYDALVFPSLMEGFGLVTVEAMGAGLPVITTANTNAVEVINDGVNGFIVPIRDTGAIVKAIGRLRAMDNASFQQMRRQARQAALQYTWNEHRERIADFITNLNQYRTLQPGV